MLSWTQCTCGRTWEHSSEASRDTQLRRCKKQHVARDGLALSDARVTLPGTLFLILSHAGASHNHRLLVDELLTLGADRDQIKVVYGSGQIAIIT